MQIIVQREDLFAQLLLSVYISVNGICTSVRIMRKNLSSSSCRCKEDNTLLKLPQSLHKSRHDGCFTCSSITTQNKSFTMRWTCDELCDFIQQNILTFVYYKGQILLYSIFNKIVQHRIPD